MEEAYLLLSQDATLSRVLERYGRPIRSMRQPGFAALVHIILEQQVSIASADAAYRKLETFAGGITPETMLSLSDEEFRKCGISRQKTSYIRNMSLRVCNGSLDFDTLAQKDIGQIASELLAIKGVGKWAENPAAAWLPSSSGTIIFPEKPGNDKIVSA